jgi:hypothetical protein
MARLVGVIDFGESLTLTWRGEAPILPQLRRLRVPRLPRDPDPRFDHLMLSGAA